MNNIVYRYLRPAGSPLIPLQSRKLSIWPADPAWGQPCPMSLKRRGRRQPLGHKLDLCRNHPTGRHGSFRTVEILLYLRLIL